MKNKKEWESLFDAIEKMNRDLFFKLLKEVVIEDLEKKKGEKMKDFTKGIKKAISNLSRAAEKCVEEFKDFEKYSNMTISEYEKEKEVKDTTGPPQTDKEYENSYLRMSAYPMEDFGYTHGTPRKGDDWKILDVNCLPEKWWEKDRYDFEAFEINSKKINNWESVIEYRIESIASNIVNGFFKYRYHIKQIKKTHEELAEEWLNNNFPGTSSRGVAITAFIAGRKSMECDKSPEVKKRIHGLDW